MSSSLPSEWKITTLESNAHLITDGSHFSPVTTEFGKPIATVQNMRGRRIDVSSCRLISEDKFDELAKGNCLPLKGDVLFSKDGTIGKTFVYHQNDRIVLLSSIAIIRLNQQKLNPDYCTQYLQSSLFYKQLENAKSGSAIRRVVLKDIKLLELPTPNIPEQQKIAKILTSVDEVIEKTQAQIDKLKDLKTGMMQELLTKGIGPGGVPHTEFKDSPVGRIPVGWEVAPLSQVVKKERPITYGIVQTGQDVENGIPCVRVVDLMTDDMSPKRMIRTSNEINESYKRTVLQIDDIMFALRGNIGHVRIVKSELVKANLTRGVALISASSGISSRFLLWAIRSPGVRKIIMDGVNGSALQEIPLGNLRSVLVPLPLSDEQSKISATLDSIEQKIETTKLKLKNYSSLKKALMQDLLTGKVRVKIDKETAIN